jgi:hypothetical protein
MKNNLFIYPFKQLDNGVVFNKFYLTLKLQIIIQFCLAFTKLKTV